MKYLLLYQSNHIWKYLQNFNFEKINSDFVRETNIIYSWERNLKLRKEGNINFNKTGLLIFDSNKN